MAKLFCPPPPSYDDKAGTGIQNSFSSFSTTEATETIESNRTDRVLFCGEVTRGQCTGVEQLKIGLSNCRALRNDDKTNAALSVRNGGGGGRNYKQRRANRFERAIIKQK